MKNFFHLIRAVFPRWNFFDDIGYEIQLQYRTTLSPSWHPIEFLHPHRRLTAFFYNPGFNLDLAKQSLLEHFILDPSPTSHRMVDALVRSHLVSAGQGQYRYRFKLVAIDRQERGELFASEWSQTPAKEALFR